MVYLQIRRVKIFLTLLKNNEAILGSQMKIIWSNTQMIFEYGSSVTEVINPSLVLVQSRKTRPYITEILLMGRKESNQKIKKVSLKSMLWETSTWEYFFAD